MARVTGAWRWTSFLLLVLVACDPPELAPLDGSVAEEDAGWELDDAAVAEEDAGPPPLADGTSRLGDCPEGAPSRCADRTWDRGRWHFRFGCPVTSIWSVSVRAETERATLRVQGTGGAVIAASEGPAAEHELAFTSLEPLGTCTAVVELPVTAAFSIAIVQLEPALDVHQCDELCLFDSSAGVERGCDCDRTCHDPCRAFGTDCGLPCNRDVPGYACPFLEVDIAADPDCTYYESDTGSFEHVGRCYRCGTGQQCCYTDGRDNGSGSFDLCPPLDPGANDPDPNGCSGVFDHCDCDVIPLCGCMAESGDLELCGECVGEGNFDLLSCNAPGDDGTFCQRAAQAALEGWSWCAIVGDITRCFDLPPGF